MEQSIQSQFKDSVESKDSSSGKPQQTPQSSSRLLTRRSSKSCTSGAQHCASQKDTQESADNVTHPEPSTTMETDPGASSGPTVPSQSGAGGPGVMDKMTKIMHRMAKSGGSPAMPGIPKGETSDIPQKGPKPAMMSKGGDMTDMMKMKSKSGMPHMFSKGGMPDMMSKGGMPDMMSMMSKGGMPDMMSKGGMPDMMSMMSKGGMPDMMSMMSKGGGMPDMKGAVGHGGGNPMQALFHNIIEMTFAEPDSDSSDEDSDAAIEMPCKHCSRIFTSRMLLNTHILVNHDHDTSVLNIKNLAIHGKGKRGVKDLHGARRKKSRDIEIPAAQDAAGFEPKPHRLVTQILSREDLSAAESERGVKRGRSTSKESPDVDSGGASGEPGRDPEADPDAVPAAESWAVPSSFVLGSSPDTRKRVAQLRPRSCARKSEQVTPKRSKGARVTTSSESEDSPSSESDKARGDPKPVLPMPNKPESSSSATPKHKRTKALSKAQSPGSSPPSRFTRSSKQDRDISSDTDSGADSSSNSGSHQGRQFSRPADHASQLVDSPTALRRSLRSRKSQ